MTQSDTGPTTTSPDPAATEQTRLRTGVISPRKALFFTLSGLAVPSVISGEGGKLSLITGWSAWLAILVGSLMALLLATIVVRFARRHLTTGSLMSFVNREVGTRAGALTGVALLVGYVAVLVLLTAVSLVFFGSFLRSVGLEATGPVFQSAVGVVILAAVVALTWRGISLSVNAAVILGWASLPFVLVMMGGAIVNHGVELGPQLSLTGFSAGGFAEAVILSFGIYAGFEGFTALALETSEPRRTIPRLLMTAVIVLGVVSVLGVVLTIPIMMSHSQDLLQGSSPLNILSTTGRMPLLGSFSDALMFVTLLGVVLVYMNEAGRVVATAAKDGLLPRALAHVDGRHQVPLRAMVFLALLAGGILVAFLLFSGQPIFTIFISAGMMVSYSWFVAYILIAIAGVVDAVRRRHLVFGLLALLSATATTGTAVFSLTQQGQDTTMPALPWIALGFIALLWATALINRRNRPVTTTDHL